MQNFVAACERCNLAKSARMPGPLQRARIHSRRARYFPAGIPTAVGEWRRGGAR
jgi:5-methylcytosine-specific restriction endonuclease McrA